MLDSRTVLSCYPELLNVLPTDKLLKAQEYKRRDFLITNIDKITNALIGQPYLRRNIARFLKIEQLSITKTGISVLSKAATNLLWEIYNSIKTERNVNFIKHCKNASIRLTKDDKQFANKVAKIIYPLFSQVKNPQFTRNIELQQFVLHGTFNNALCIKNFQSRILAQLNFNANQSPVIPVVLTTDKFLFPEINAISLKDFDKAQQYYSHILQTMHGNNYYFGRIELGVKEVYDFNMTTPKMSGVIHMHAMVNPVCYHNWLKANKIARRSSKTITQFKLKTRELKKKQQKQTLEQFEQRELSYSLKFSTLEGMDNKDYYVKKNSRLDFAQNFHHHNRLFVNNMLNTFYSKALVYNKKFKKTYNELKSVLKDDESKILLNMYKQLTLLKPKTIKVIPARPGIKSAGEHKCTASRFKLKKHANFVKLHRFFDQSLRQIKPQKSQALSRLTPPPQRKYQKPPD
jgi:hypothetical protein